MLAEAEAPDFQMRFAMGCLEVATELGGQASEGEGTAPQADEATRWIVVDETRLREDGETLALLKPGTVVESVKGGEDMMRLRVRWEREDGTGAIEGWVSRDSVRQSDQ